MNSRALRNAARVALPEGAFLRRDRGEALFVTDAPRIAASVPWQDALAEAGFLIEERGGLAFLTPGPGWLGGLEAEYHAPLDEFCRGFIRFAGRKIEPESLALFALGARILDGGADEGRFDRRLRQRAAVCMRDKSTSCGGGLYACALLDYLIKEEST